MTNFKTPCRSIIFLLIPLSIVILISTVSVFPQNRYVTVIAINANLRSTPTSSGKILDVVEQDETYRLIEQRGPWYLVETENYVGWLHGNTIRLSSKAAKSLYRESEKQITPPTTWSIEPKTERPYSGAIINSGSSRSGLGSLSISNGTDNDAIVKLIDVSTDTSYREVYIHAYSTATISSIAVGDYRLLFSLGKGYAPSLNRFTQSPSYSKFDSLINFSETKEVIGNTIRTNYDSYRLTLNRVVGGNAKTSMVDPSEFEKY